MIIHSMCGVCLKCKDMPKPTLMNINKLKAPAITTSVLPTDGSCMFTKSHTNSKAHSWTIP